MRGRSFSIRLFLLLLASASLPPARATSAAAGEAEIKAAMIFNFTKFIEWPPARTDGPLVIGVAGDDGVREALEELAKGRPGGRAVQVRRVEQAAEAEPCHLLFIGRGAKKRSADLLAAARHGVATVGDADGFARSGGAIGFLVADNKLRFEISLAAAGQAGVTISSRLLRLATEVRP